ncbi:putative ATPase [Herbihabitans rhizosphaerae]|uniref:Putative ATPase n=1 Tax=Herbihabitans rhizosphaerae TaxID=1872711 RepID=A0A4Q7KJ30_9PSEU|nr:putative ATPase [Herbihabitans rhizosphaerae]
MPRQLPLAARHFTGRVEHLAALDALLPDESDDTCAGVISAVDGTAGVGKTALAVRWSYRVQHHFPDGTLYANLRGYGPGDPATPGEILGGFLGALGVSAQQIPAGLEAQAGLYRSELARRRVLIVLDNASAAEQVRPMLPGGPGCAVVVTSRASLTGLVVGEGATRVTLGLLTEREAVELVRATLGHQRADAEPDAVIELIKACARLPLALRIAAGRAAARPYLTVADLVAELGSERGRWEALSVSADERTSVRAVFGWSYHQLTGAQARMFRRLGLHPGPEISLHAAAAAAGVDVLEARRLLNALAESHLIEPIARDRYRIHDLLRAYAIDRADHDDTPGDRNHALRTLAEWYAHHARIAYQAIIPWNADWHAAADLDTHARPEIAFPGSVEAWAWFDRECVNVIAMVRAATRHHGLSPLAILMADVFAQALSHLATWDDALEVARLGLAAARRIGDRAAECYLLQSQGVAHQGAAHQQEAIDAFQAALALARELDDVELWALVLSYLGWVCVAQEQYAQAQEYLRSALPLVPDPKRGRLGSFIEYNLSGVYIGLGDYDQAFRHAERSLAYFRVIGYRDPEIYALHQMARARQGVGAHPDAIALCEQALAIGEPRCRDPQHRAVLLDTLGTSLLHTGDVTRAIACWREAIAIFDDLGVDRADDLRERLGALETG